MGKIYLLISLLVIGCKPTIQTNLSTMDINGKLGFKCQFKMPFSEWNTVAICDTEKECRDICNQVRGK